MKNGMKRLQPVCHIIISSDISDFDDAISAQSSTYRKAMEYKLVFYTHFGIQQKIQPKIHH